MRMGFYIFFIIYVVLKQKHRENHGCVFVCLNLFSVRLILFCLIWLLTLGRHHFWLLPNLTEDVGFFESFRPLYKHETVSKDLSVGSKEKPSKSVKPPEPNESQGSHKGKEKVSDKEDSGSEQEEFEMISKREVEGEEKDEESLEEGQGEGVKEEEEVDHKPLEEEEEYGPDDEEYEEEDQTRDAVDDNEEDVEEEDQIEEGDHDEYDGELQSAETRKKNK